MSGTTDTPCEPHARPEATEREIQFILGEIDGYLDCNIKVREGFKTVCVLIYYDRFMTSQS